MNNNNEKNFSWFGLLVETISLASDAIAVSRDQQRLQKLIDYIESVIQMFEDQINRDDQYIETVFGYIQTARSLAPNAHLANDSIRRYRYWIEETQNRMSEARRTKSKCQDILYEVKEKYKTSITEEEELEVMSRVKSLI